MLPALAVLFPLFAAAAGERAVPAGAAPSGQVEGLERIGKEFARLCVRLDAQLAGLKAIDGLIAGSSDPEALIRRHEDGKLEFQVSLGALDALRSVHQEKLQGLHFIVYSQGILGARRGRARVDPAAGRIMEYERAAEEMAAKHDEIVREMTRMDDEFPRIAEAGRRRRSVRRFLFIGGSAAVMLGAAAAAVAWRRFSRRRITSLAPSDPPKLVAGRYKVVRKIGRGATGQAYEAVDRKRGRRAFLKRLDAKLLETPGSLERLKNEADLLASRPHPNIVKVYSVEEQGGRVFIVSEFVAGTTLERRLALMRKLPWAESLDILRGAGAALDEAHGRGVVHRDFKPANLMLSRAGVVKVADFGIAVQAAHYMSPEQHMGESSPAGDRFALAVCFYEMLTGAFPFEGPNFLAQKSEGRFIPPSRRAADLPAGLDDLFVIALAPAANRRFPTAAALISACAAIGA